MSPPSQDELSGHSPAGDSSTSPESSTLDSAATFLLHFTATLPPASIFYLLQALTLLLLWIAVFAGSGVDFLRLGQKLSNTALKPSWLSKRGFLFVLQSEWLYLACAYSIVPLMFVAGWVENSEGAFSTAENYEISSTKSRTSTSASFSTYARPILRLLIAVAVTIFHLGDSCRTSSHRDYLMLYNCWVLAFAGLFVVFFSPNDLPEYEVLASATSQWIAFGLCIWYIFTCGVSKVVIGGAKEWACNGTLLAILETFSRKSPRGGGPVLGVVTRSLVKPLLDGRSSEKSSAPPAPGYLDSAKRFFLNAAATFTLLFECVAAPLCLVFPSIFYLRVLLGAGMIFLHLAIGALQSGAIGAFFLPCAASYAYGLTPVTQDANESLSLYYLSIIVAISPVAYGLVFKRPSRLVSEDWPFSPMALFPWNNVQWAKLHDLLVRGDTRLVVVVASQEDEQPGLQETKKGTTNRPLEGLRVIPIEYDAEVPLMERQTGPLPGERSVAYDLWSRVIGITTFQDVILQEILASSAKGGNEKYTSSSLAQRLTEATRRFLVETQRVIEVSSGTTLTDCYFVRVDRKTLRIVEVIH
ncbi:unnamed protein product [Amoebophrya sp. A25]|nr:unnamed protein product [Amoebophrya sp. A25]|eukprot:GSA25T00008023001.1